MHADPRAANCFHLPLDTYSLPNGLKVILHPDDTLPVTAVHVRYNVGSKDDHPDRTGLAHLVEHLMFEGSAGHDADYFKPLQEAGGVVNGTTGFDATNYYELVPSNFLERALWLEADRMCRLLEVLTEEKFENQRSVVKNERWQRCDNQPYGRVGEELMALLYPAHHPYHWPIIGWMKHLDSMTLHDARTFIKRFYSPANAVLTIAGVFDRTRLDAWISDYFGVVGGNGPLPVPKQDLGALTHDRRVELSEPVALGRIDIAWPTVPRYHPDEAPLDVAAQLLGGGKDSRWRRRLERIERLAHSASTYHACYRLAGHFGLRAYGLPGVSMERIVDLIPELLREFHNDPPQPEQLQRVVRAFEVRAYDRVETLLGKASMLQEVWFHRGEVNPEALAEELDRYRRVTPSDVVRVMDDYFGQSRAMVLVHPVAESTPAAAPAAPPSRVEKKARHADSINLPGPGPSASFEMPVVNRASVGELDVLVVTDRRIPRIQFELILEAGSAYEVQGQWGISRLTAGCLNEGTRRLTSLELTKRLETLGAQISCARGIETLGVMMRSLQPQLAESFALLGEVVAEPGFRSDDVDRERKKHLAELSHREHQPNTIADDAIERLLFGDDHPYGRCPDGIATDVESLTPDHLRAFYRLRATPRGAILLAVGDVRPEEISDLAQRELGPWLSSQAELLEAPSVSITPSETSCALIPRPGALQAVIRVGRPAPERKTKDYEALVLLNTIVGGSFTSRLNAHLRETKGFTYGANSSFALRRASGAFIAGADVDARVTPQAVRAMLQEILGPSSNQPITEEELSFAKSYITRRFPVRFETQAGILAHLAHAATYGLPDDYYHTYLSRLNAVTLDQVNQAAREHLSAQGMKVVVVGSPELQTELLQVVHDCLRAE